MGGHAQPGCDEYDQILLVQGDARVSGKGRRGFLSVPTTRGSLGDAARRMMLSVMGPERFTTKCCHKCRHLTVENTPGNRWCWVCGIALGRDMNACLGIGLNYPLEKERPAHNNEPAAAQG